MRPDGRAWPGFQKRFCPVCGRPVDTHREPINDHRKEMVVYHQHTDTTMTSPCPMAGKRAAIRAVAFTAADTGAPPIRTYGRKAIA